MTVQEIAQYLDDQGIGTYDEVGDAGDIFLCVLPDEPGAAIMLRPTGGAQGDGKLTLDRETVQIVIRGADLDPVPPGNRAQSVYDLLHGFHHQSFIAGGAWILNCRAVQPAAHVGRDENGRHEYSINFEIDLENTNRRE